MAVTLDELVARIQNRMRGASSGEEASLAAVQTICRAWRIPYGEVWTNYTGRQVVYLEAAWHLPGLDFSEFEEASRKFAFAPGVSIPGTVWQSRRPHIIEDLRTAPEFSRQAMALAAGFRAAAGMPVFFREELVAVLAFFMFKPGRRLIDSIGIIADAVSNGLAQKAEGVEDKVDAGVRLSLVA